MFLNTLQKIYRENDDARYLYYWGLAIGTADGILFTCIFFKFFS